MALPKGFQSGDEVQLRVERRGGLIDWVPAQVRTGSGLHDSPWRTSDHRRHFCFPITRKKKVLNRGEVEGSPLLWCDLTTDGTSSVFPNGLENTIGTLQHPLHRCLHLHRSLAVFETLRSERLVLATSVAR